MATKVHPNAKQEIDAYIEEMQPFAKAICKKLRSIILKADPSIQEDWKWGPHYSGNGMVCGYGGSEDLQQALDKNKAALAFFNDLSYVYKKDFVEWVTTARREETRKDRIGKVIAMCKEKRRMNDHYK